MGWEADLLLWIQDNIRNPIITPIAKLFALIGNHGEFSIAVALLFMIWPKYRKQGYVIAISLASSALVSGLIKHIVGRTRPYNAIDGLEPLVSKLSDSSFPSGHSLAAFGCMFVVFLLLPKRYGIPALCYSIFMALSRLYLGVHYPTDVIAGTLLGIFFAVVTTTVYKKKFAPALPAEELGKDNE